jgi:hypothetical protein
MTQPTRRDMLKAAVTMAAISSVPFPFSAFVGKAAATFAHFNEGDNFMPTIATKDEQKSISRTGGRVRPSSSHTAEADSRGATWLVHNSRRSHQCRFARIHQGLSGRLAVTALPKIRP